MTFDGGANIRRQRPSTGNQRPRPRAPTNRWVLACGLTPASVNVCDHSIAFVRYSATLGGSLRNHLLLLCGLLTACTPQSSKWAAPSVTPTEAAILQSVMEERAAKNDGYGGVLLALYAGDGEMLWEAAAGPAELHGPDLTPSDAFEIASITKTITAITALLLVEQGHFSLDTPLGDLLPDETSTGLLVIQGYDWGPEITIRQLLQHTSGLPDYWADPPFQRPGVNAFLADFLDDRSHHWTADELVEAAANLDPISVPGTTWHYADTNYVLLGMVIEEVTASPLHLVFDELLFSPLEMNDTWMVYDEAPPSSRTLCHRYEGREDLTLVPRQSADWAGGGLATTTADLARLFVPLASGALFARLDTQEAFLTSVATDEGRDIRYGLGNFQVQLDGGYGHLWGHTGWGNSFVWWWPEQEVLMVGTVNQTNTNSERLEVAAIDALWEPGHH